MGNVVDRERSVTEGGLAPPRAEILTPIPTSTQRETIIIRGHRGFLATIAVGMSLCLVLLVGAWIIGRWGGSQWLEAHRQAVHADSSRVSIAGRDNLNGLEPGEITLVLRDDKGGVVRVAAQREAVAAFEREIIFFLKRRMEEGLTQYREDVSKAFDAAFADSEEALNSYADWFFEWKRSWILLKEAVAGGATELLNILTPSKIWEGATARVRDYLMDHYQSRVLKPDIRQPILQRGLADAFQSAHTRFRAVIDELGGKEAAFVRDHTRLLERYEPEAVQVTLDWGSQKWKIPAHVAEDRAEAAYRSVAVMGASVVITPLFAPMIRSVAEPILARVAGRVVGENSGAIIGAFLGAETFGLSLVIGAVADYGLNKLDEHLSRENFIRDHRTALDETRSGWMQLTLDELLPVVGSWYADTQKAVIASGERAAPTGRI